MTMPAPNPTAVREAMTLRAEVTRSLNSSRMMPKASGEYAAPGALHDPGRDQPPDRGASAAAREPRARADSVTTSIRFLPTASPRRPSSGVQTDADRR